MEASSCDTSSDYKIIVPWCIEFALNSNCTGRFTLDDVYEYNQVSASNNNLRDIQLNYLKETNTMFLVSDDSLIEVKPQVYIE